MVCQTLWVPLDLPLRECMHSITGERKRQKTARQWQLKPHRGAGEIFGCEQLNYFVNLAILFEVKFPGPHPYADAICFSWFKQRMRRWTTGITKVKPDTFFSLWSVNTQSSCSLCVKLRWHCKASRSSRSRKLAHWSLCQFDPFCYSVSQGILWILYFLLLFFKLFLFWQSL